MKIQSMKMLLVLGLLIGIGNLTARAQGLIDDTSIEADVPHAFVVKDKTLPAGKYTIKRLDETQPNVLEISSANGRTAFIFETETAQTSQVPRKAELVFDKIGDQYFLSQIWPSDSTVGYQLPKTKAQESLEGRGMKAERHSIFTKVFKRTNKGT